MASSNILQNITTFVTIFKAIYNSDLFYIIMNKKMEVSLMKKIIILLGFTLCMATSAYAIPLDNQPGTLIIDGTVISKSQINKMQYSGFDNTTTIYLRNGNTLVFPTSYDEYGAIYHASRSTDYVVSQNIYVPFFYGPIAPTRQRVTIVNSASY